MYQWFFNVIFHFHHQQQPVNDRSEFVGPAGGERNAQVRVKEEGALLR